VGFFKFQVQDGQEYDSSEASGTVKGAIERMSPEGVERSQTRRLSKIGP